jgi:outer membrane protein assembly factor BamD
VEAVAAYEDFLREYPDHPRTADVPLQTRSVYYHQILTIDRDQTATRNALATFEMLTTKFPRDSRTQEAKQYIAECRERLAASELYVGRFYFRTGRYEAAINRLTTCSRTTPISKSRTRRISTWDAPILHRAKPIRRWRRSTPL